MKFSAAVIGTGRIGYLLQKDKKREQPASHAAALAKSRHISLIAGCDINTERLMLWKKDYPRTACYGSAQELMQKEKPDLVVVAVSEDAHTEVALDVIKHKPKLIILEKPVGPNLAAAEQIRKAAARYKVPICVNHERRFSLDYLAAAQLIRNKELGDLQTVSGRLWSSSPIWTPSCAEKGDCSLIHDGTHLIDILHFLLEQHLKKPTVDRIVKNKRSEIRLLNLHYKLSKNGLLCLELNGNSEIFDFEITFNGTRGKLIIGNGYLKLYTKAPSPYYSGFSSLKRRKKVRRPRITGYFSRMVENCVDFLLDKAPLISPLSEGIRTLKALYEIVEYL
ncbi:MAG: Gfo/Idh/MocA family oxidoreductase [Spirochaetales bacterium]|nr:Gfo/Idh/MocA family oxidoreductase [Spirochaetales bacterium]